MTARKGFTLIELLVVISIIAVLSAIAIVAFGTVSKNGRDAKRVADLKTIQGSLEQYYADQGGYPGDLNSKLSSGESLTDPADTTKVYFNKLPKDPTSTQNYTYASFRRTGSTYTQCTAEDTNCSTYCLYAILENSKNFCNETNRYSGVIACDPALSNTSSLCNDAGRNFAITPP